MDACQRQPGGPPCALGQGPQRGARDVYALAAVAGASVYVLLDGLGVAVTVSAPVSVAAVLALRLAAIRWDLHAPSFDLEEEDRPG